MRTKRPSLLRDIAASFSLAHFGNIRSRSLAADAKLAGAPEFHRAPHQPTILVPLKRFHEKGIRSQLIAVGDFARGSDTREYDDRQALEARITLEFRED